jgi:6-phosphogluconolactonase
MPLARPAIQSLCLVLASLFSVHSLRAAPTPVAANAASTSANDLVYVGTYTGPKSKGIYAFRLQTQNEEVSQNVLLVPLGLAAATPNPSFLAVDPKRNLVFAVNELQNFEGQATGAVSAFSADPATGKLTLLNQRPSGGTDPCHLVLDATGQNLLVANYSSGSVSVIRVQADGHLGETTAFIQNHGKGPNPARQESPHAHCVTLDAANRFAFVCDLGLDQVLVYKFDAAAGTLTPASPAFTALPPGSGPRHLVFRPDGKFAYVINELSSTVTTFAYDAATGRLTAQQTVSTLSPDFDGQNTAAEIGITPRGQFLYASNRGQNSIALFSIDPAKGTLDLVEQQFTGGKKPRHFGIPASGKFVVAANQDSDSLLVCRVDSGNGRLQPSGVLAEAPSPVCTVFLPTLTR